VAGGVPAIRVQDEIGQPMLVDGQPVSFWRAVTGGDLRPTQADLARLLANFHQLPAQLAPDEDATLVHQRLEKKRDGSGRMGP
jgi:hypothetical protein